MQDLVGSWMQNSLFKSALHYELKNEMEMPEVDWVAPDEFPDLRNSTLGNERWKLLNPSGHL